MTINAIPVLRWKSVLAVLMAIFTISATITVSTQEAEARRGRNAALGLGIIGGLVLGAALADAAGRDDYRPRRYRHRHDQRRYYRQARYDNRYYYQRPRCRVRTVRSYDDYGYPYHRRVRVCR